MKKKAKTRRTRTVPLQTSTIILLSVVLLFAIGILFYSFGAGRVGKAVEIGEQPYLGEINLEKQQSVIFTQLPTPEKNTSASFLINTKLYGPANKNITFSAFVIEEGLYGFMVKERNLLIARDLLQEEIHSQVYLDEDLMPDFIVLLQNGKITVTNTHYLSPGKTALALLDSSGNVYGPLIKVEENGLLTATVNATSTKLPLLKVKINGEAIPLADQVQINTTATATISWQAGGSEAVIMEIEATVDGEVTKAYYTIVVGSIIYAHDMPGFPRMLITSTDLQNATLIVTLRPTTALQPFALPCALQSEQVDAFFAGAKVKKIYSYDAATKSPLLWAQGAPANDFSQLTVRSGYFVELSAAEETTINASCTISSLVPLQSVPALDNEKIKKLEFKKGWNLFSLPGTYPLDISVFLPEGTEVTLYSCKEGYECGLAEGTSIQPGRPYWLFTGKPIELAYVTK